MTYASLMVNLDLATSNAHVLQVAAFLAHEFNTCLIGIAVKQITQIYHDNGPDISADIIKKDHRDNIQMMTKAEMEFRTSLKFHIHHLEWHSKLLFDSEADYLAQEARSADLIIANMPTHKSNARPNHMITSLLMQVGRPMLLVPKTLQTPRFERIILAWKDTMETRRAAMDAIPLLKKAKHVVVVELVDEVDISKSILRLTDVETWLQRHGITAEIIASPLTGDATTLLKSFVSEQKADLLVAGAYGHSRLQEWIMGGITRDLLICADCCTFLSH
jgi:nucleotide-binding universal stress UspA family protein